MVAVVESSCEKANEQIVSARAVLTSILFGIGFLLNPVEFDAEPLEVPECVHQMTSDDAMWVRNAKKAWAREKTIRLFKEVVWKVYRSMKSTHRLPIGNLSLHGGGRLKPHRSHKDGLDVDSGYYFTDGRFRKWFGKPTRRHLDTARQ